MHKYRGHLAGVFLLLVFLVAPGGVSAATYYGCQICKSVGLTGIAQICWGVGHGEHGDGTICHERNDLGGGTACWLDGGPCYNVVVTDGGGGWSGGGSGSCNVGGGQFCPAECFSCGGSGRPAV